MSRRLFAGLLGVAVAAAAGLPTAAQEKKKEQPKKERVAVADPGKARADPDFTIQGEYVGDLTTKDGKAVKFGAQVVAKGGGKFSLKLLSGGLPGAGWDRMTVTTGELATGGAGKGAKPADQKLWGGIAD